MDIPVSNYKVLVRCFTYNQSSYILDCLNGFAAQQTSFPFVCLIMDDSSTDGEQDVLREFIDTECECSGITKFDIPEAVVVLAQHKNNSNCFFSFYFLKKNLYKEREKKFRLVEPWQNACEYEAFCEGDDYWTDSLKIQKQVDFLDNNSDYSLCFHDAKVQKGDEILDSYIVRDVPATSTVEDLFKGNYIHTPTVLCVIYKDVNESIIAMGQTVVGDYPRWVLTATKGKIYKFKEPMAVYRYGVGIWSGNPDYVGTSISWLVMLSKLSCVIERKYQKAIDSIISEQKKQVKAYAYRLENSWDFKIGSFLLKPIHKIKDRLYKKNKCLR